MRVTRVFAIGVVVAGGVGIGCGEDGTNSTATESSALQASKVAMKAPRIEGFVKETDLVSDLAGARKTDPDLRNAWGLVLKDGFAWIATNHSSTDRQYDEDGKSGQVINLPLSGDPPDAPTSAPTGQVVNPFPDAFHGDHFIVVSEDGVVFGVNPAEAIATKQPESIVEVDNNAAGANYKGVALSTFHGKPRLFATDFRNRKIDVFDENFATPAMGGDFTDKQLQDLKEVGSTGEPAQYAPFNIQAFGDHLLLVTYALQLLPDADDDDKGPGRGFVDIFDTDGHFIQRLISRGALNSPWGLALSPRTKADRSTDLLVGNFGDGHINVYELREGGHHFRADFEGALGNVKTHQPLAIDGLWAIVFGSGQGGFDRDDIYFTAGPNDEDNGLFGELDFVSPRR